MRRTSVLLASTLGFVAFAATAATVGGQATPFDRGTFDNVVPTEAGGLKLAESHAVVADWRRNAWDGQHFEVRADNQQAGLFGGVDVCVPVDGPDSVDLGGAEYLLVPGQSIADATLLEVPASMAYVPELRFLTTGTQDVADAAYDIVFHYGQDSASVGPIPVRPATEAAREDSGAGWHSLPWDAAALVADTCGPLGDEILVANPWPELGVTGVEFAYDDTVLGGPLALTLVTDEASLDATFGVRGSFSSSIAVDEALDAGEGALWQQLELDVTVPHGSEIHVSFRCGDDRDGSGVLEDSELSRGQGYTLTASSSTTIDLLDPCSGQYGQVTVDFIEGGTGMLPGDQVFRSPLSIGPIVFAAPPDVDMDGFDNTVDCDDNEPTTFPGAPEVIDDGVDQDCDGGDLCYLDADDDGDRHDTDTIVSANLNCNQANEAHPADPVDCDDNDPNRNSGETEIIGDGIDQDCDLRDDCYEDIDRDGDGDSNVVTSTGATCLTSNQEATTSGPDCDDNDATRFTGATEIAGNNNDESCNDREVCYEDADNDGARHPTATFQTIAGDHDCTENFEGEATDPEDCDDNDPGVGPGGTEAPGNNVDEDCDGTVECYQDVDNDGARHATLTLQTLPGDTDCTDNFEGQTGDDIDCDDNDPLTNPSASEIVGNNNDEDCNGIARCYDDVDNDGDRATSTTNGNSDLDCNDNFEGLSTDLIDCDDDDATRHSGATESPGDNVDQDCNNTELCYHDVDNDGARLNTTFETATFDTNCTQASEGEVGDPIDCNDNDAAIKPGVAELVGDNVDQNCDNVEDCYTDADNDGARLGSTNIGGDNGDADCNDAREGVTADVIDCDDTDAAIRPGVAEIAGDNVDQNCDNAELCFQDDDDDGDRDTTTTGGNGDADCNDANEGLVGDPIDCDETDAAINSGATEIAGDNVDQNCDNVELCFQDDDNDGDRDTTTHTGNGDADCNDANEGRVIDPIDCADQDATRSSSEDENDWIGNEIDNDCDGGELCYRDQDDDGDRHLTNTAISADTDCTDQFEARDTTPIDCDDLDDTEYNGAPEICDGQDNDCNTVLPGNEIDNDSDGYVECTFDGGGWDGVGAVIGDEDCDDGRALTNPGATDTCGNGIDDNCDGIGNWGVTQDFLDDDDDGLDYATEQGLGTDDCDDDSDNDNLDDDEEVLLTNTDPTNPDTDNDLVIDGTEVSDPFNPINTDGDGLHDALDDDDDNDGILTRDEDIDGNGNPRNDDTDGDGLRNMWDTDDDDDTIPTNTENYDGDNDWFDQDTDGDGTPDFLDDEDDGDGIPTELEAVEGNTDGDGLPDYRDNDDDNDSLLTIDEQYDGIGTAYNDDTDGDGTPNYQDTDDDNDTLATIDEVSDAVSGDDRDGDGDDNWVDTDADDDTYLDSEERRINTDGDQFLDYLDLDSDDDTVDDIDELREDLDGDTDDNRVDDDDDGDGIDTAQEESDPGGGDGDGLRNYRDLDSDGDNWDDTYEWTVFTGSRDTDGDGLNNYVDTDSDNDSIDDDDELGNMASPVDTDGDGDENRIDDDDDGDSLLTIEEDRTTGNPLTEDFDGDGLEDYIDDDDDDDWVGTIFEGPNVGANGQDTDGDGLPDYHDVDDDGDTLLTTVEDVDGDGNPRDDDTDGDGTPNYVDNDDDNDLIDTPTEINACGGPDTDGDGIPNSRDTDSDNDGYTDQHEWTNGLVTDFDGDGCDDFADEDSDDDSVLDTNELPVNTDGTQGENRIDVDDDGDSLLTINELTTDSDSDGVLNYIDSDDDDDEVPTVSEIGNPNPGLHDDADGDGTYNYLDIDDDNDGELTSTEDPFGGNTPADDDWDGDGIFNYLDVDDDGDQIDTIIENAAAPGRDPDGDGLDNHLDDDSDGDYFLDTQETQAGLLYEFDGDGIYDFLDTDSDNDSVPDDREGQFAGNEVNTDGDSRIDRVDTDDDDDLIPTLEECSDNCGGAPWQNDWDLDGEPDYLDLDDDNDSVLTRDEDANGDGDPRDDNTDSFFVSIYSNPDALPDWLDDDDDGDGLLTIEEGGLSGDPLQEDADLDGTPNFREEDDDGDGILTAIETSDFDDPINYPDPLSTDPRDYDWPDGDGLPNFIDVDDDNDRVETFCEYGYGIDHLAPDVDGDTVLDGDEWYNFIYLDLVLIQGRTIDIADYSDTNGGLTGLSCTDPWDRDSDGVINALEADDDGDGLTTGLEEIGTDLDCLPGTGFPAGDGIPDYLDWDSDDDGLLDDRYGDGVTSDGLGDDDGDGIVDFLDCDDSGCAGDSDVDGIQNCDEQTLCPVIDPPNPSWCALDPDMDDDGVIDGVELGGNLALPLDTDGDGEPDFYDTDDDADSFDSAIENGIYCAKGEPLAVDYDPILKPYWTFSCRDLAGVMQTYDFGGNDLDDYPNTDAPTGLAFPREPDDIPDFRDPDDDGDGVLTIDEGNGDIDGDGVPDYLDPNDDDGPDGDPDGDGIPTSVEIQIGQGLDPYDDDSDDDGLSDGDELYDSYGDIRDSDGDGDIDAADPYDDEDTIHTRIEGSSDVDQDGIPNHLDDDSDGDGLLDSEEADAQGNPYDDDCDGIYDFLDRDHEDGPCRKDTGRFVAELYERQGCHCATPTSGAGGWMVLALGGLLLRRRR